MFQDSVIFLQASDSNANVDGMHPNTFFFPWIPRRFKDQGQGLKTYVNTDASVAFLAGPSSLAPGPSPHDGGRP